MVRRPGPGRRPPRAVPDRDEAFDVVPVRWWSSLNGVERLDELDALRGLAALTVVGQHCLMVSPWIGGGAPPGALPPAWVGFAGLPPLAALWSGQEAVTLFFVLSGFVLALPFQRGAVSVPAWCAPPGDPDLPAVPRRRSRRASCSGS